jgi:hypothetical protein
LKDVKQNEPRIFVNDDLSKQRSILAAKARGLKKDDRIGDTWSNDGVIFIKVKHPSNEGKILRATTDDQMDDAGL